MGRRPANPFHGRPQLAVGKFTIEVESRITIGTNPQQAVGDPAYPDNEVN